MLHHKPQVIDFGGETLVDETAGQTEISEWQRARGHAAATELFEVLDHARFVLGRLRYLRLVHEPLATADWFGVADSLIEALQRAQAEIQGLRSQVQLVQSEVDR